MAKFHLDDYVATNHSDRFRYFDRFIVVHEKNKVIAYD